MTKPLPRTAFNSSRLIQILGGLCAETHAGTGAATGAEGAAESKTSFSERLGQWLGFTDAIALSGALNARVMPEAARIAAPTGHSVEEDCVRLRAALADSIVCDGVLRPGRARIKLPVPAASVTGVDRVDFQVYRRYYAAHQRDMEAGIGPLRARTREVLSSTSPALRQLATLDGVLEQAFGNQERDLLAGVPQLLERRFAQLKRSHQEALATAQHVENPGAWLQPGGWLAVFCQDMQAVLQAELEIRLQPVLGLLDALNEDGREHQRAAVFS